jgi:hypothetical protein
MMPTLAGLYADVDAALYTAFLTLDPVLGLYAAASLDATTGARPRHLLPRHRR